ncbi:MAG: hypothetical protein DRO00_02435 [Thermoproteota archaeon]|nr:MAG: hypothetical protein DRO00_02435 [Candidatus Korarchaeota archaeon]
MLCNDPDKDCTIHRVLDCIDYVVNLVGSGSRGYRIRFCRRVGRISGYQEVVDKDRCSSLHQRTR